MNVIVLHNNNLPDFLLQRSKTSDIIIEPVSVELPKTDVPDIDTFISTILSKKNKVNSLCQYDVIVLPFNTTNNNLEYTGLRIAAHLRLTKEWNCMSTPILFLGPDTIQEINQFSELGCLLNTYNIFFSSKRKQEEIIDMIKRIKENTKQIVNIEGSPEYKGFLKRMKSLSAPANYSSHHSIANEWGADVLGRVVLGDRFNNTFVSPTIKNSLFFKYLIAATNIHRLVLDQSQKQSSHQYFKIDASGKRILLIDDEADKGWEYVLSKMLNVRIDVISEKVVDYKSLTEESKKKIINNDYDLIFLDLRLNGVDEESVSNPEDFSGMKILSTIKNVINGGIQVIIFTASNKAWNMKALLDAGADGYYIKESPEYAFPLEYSMENARKLIDTINTCFERKYLRVICKKIQKLNSLLSFKDDINEEIINKLLLSFSLITNAESKKLHNKGEMNEIKETQKLFAYSFVSLFEILELIVKIFIYSEKANAEGRVYREYYFLDDATTVSRYRKNEKGKFIPSNKKEEFSLAQQLWSIYIEKGGELTPEFADDISVMNDKRNTFIHNKPMIAEKAVHKDIYTRIAFQDLFDVVYKVLIDLGEIYQNI